jgi:hypothetical protein
VNSLKKTSIWIHIKIYLDVISPLSLTITTQAREVAAWLKAASAAMDKQTWLSSCCFSLVFSFYSGFV